MFGIRSVWIWEFFQILEYVHVHNRMSWGWAPHLHMTFIMFHIIPSSHNLFSVPVFWLWPMHDVSCEVLYLWHVSEQKVSDSGAFWNRGFWIRDAQPVLGRCSDFLSPENPSLIIPWASQQQSALMRSTPEAPRGQAFCFPQRCSKDVNCPALSGNYMEGLLWIHQSTPNSVKHR